MLFNCFVFFLSSEYILCDLKLFSSFKKSHFLKKVTTSGCTAVISGSSFFFYFFTPMCVYVVSAGVCAAACLWNQHPYGTSYFLPSFHEFWGSYLAHKAWAVSSLAHWALLLLLLLEIYAFSNQSSFWVSSFKFYILNTWYNGILILTTINNFAEVCSSSFMYILFTLSHFLLAAIFEFLIFFVKVCKYMNLLPFSSTWKTVYYILCKNLPPFARHILEVTW